MSTLASAPLTMLPIRNRNRRTIKARFIRMKNFLRTRAVFSGIMRT